MTHLDKLVAHTVWANGEWITFAAKNFPADDFVLVRLSHILLVNGRGAQHGLCALRDTL